MNWRIHTEKKLEDFSDFVFEHSKKTILLVLLAVAGLISHLPTLTMDTSTEGFLHESDPMRIGYDVFRDQFGRDEKVLLAIKTSNIFDAVFLNKLNSLHRALEEGLPHIEKVNSLINARNTYGAEGELIVEPLIDKTPKTQSDLDGLKKTATANRLFDNMLYSEDHTMTVITIDTKTYSGAGADEVSELNFEDELDFNFEVDSSAELAAKSYLSDAENDEIIIRAQQIMADFEAEDFRIFITGSAAISGIFKQALKSDSETFISLMLVMIMFVLFLLFRRLSGVLLPLCCVALTLISTLALMAAFSTPFTMVTQIMPTFLLAVVTGSSIHLLAIFYKEYDKSADKKASLKYAMGHSGLAIIMTSLTTAAGLWSFSFSGVSPVADLGRFASSGVLIGLLFTMILLPALIATIRVKSRELRADKAGLTIMDRALLRISVISTSHPKLIVMVSSVLILCAILVASQLRFSHYPLKWLPEDNFARIATETVDEALKGSLTLEVLVDTQQTNGLYSPAVLKAIDDSAANINTIATGSLAVGKSVSFVDIIKETNRALNENRPEFYTTPNGSDLIAQELFLFESSGNEDLKDFVDDNYSMARVILQVPWNDSLEAKAFIDRAQVFFNENLTGLAVVTFTGIGTLMTVIFEQAIYSSAISYLLAFSLIAVLMVLLIGDLKIGLISMIPNLLPIIFLGMIMVIFEMPLDMFSMLIGAIALGLAVDDTVHFMHNFRRYELQYSDVDKAVRLTLMGTGRAITITSIVLALGFLVLTFSTMNNMFDFGVLTASAILVALVADFFLVPAIMKLIIVDKQDA